MVLRAVHRSSPIQQVSQVKSAWGKRGVEKHFSKEYHHSLIDTHPHGDDQREMSVRVPMGSDIVPSGLNVALE